MNTWIITQTANMATLLSEDVGAPELRNPRVSGIHSLGSWLLRAFKRGR